MKANFYDCSYDEKLLENEFLKSHDYYLPFVGVNYKDADVKILHIGNCPYIESSLDLNNQFGCNFFVKNWFNNPIELNKMPIEWTTYCMNTRAVLVEYLSATRNPDNKCGIMNYSIFSFVTKMLSNSIVAERNIGYKRTINSIRMPKDNSANCKTLKAQERRKEKYLNNLTEYKEKTKIYNYVAFTDFHMFPSLINGNAKVLSSLKKANKCDTIKNDVYKFYDEVKEKSWETLKHIIKVLQPDVILITSDSVSEIFPHSEFDFKVIKKNHPNSLFSKDAKNEYMEEFYKQVETIVNNK